MELIVEISLRFVLKWMIQQFVSWINLNYTMPKRRISELEWEDSRLQSKIHVGLKEINQGICSDSNMKAVYRKLRIMVIFRSHVIYPLFTFSEKTLDLLFKGLKPKLQSEANITAPIVTMPSKYSQMTITSNGLISNEPIKKTVSQPVTMLPCQCPSCSNFFTILSGKCKFCELSVCEGCQKPCAMCLGEFCPKCSMKV